MKRAKQILLTIPEYYLIIMAIMVGFTPPFHFNPIAIIAALVLFLQVMLKYWLSGLILSVLFLLVNGYLIYTLILEFNKYATITDQARLLLLLGLIILLINLFVNGIMFYKYAIKKNRPIFLLDRKKN